MSRSSASMCRASSSPRRFAPRITGYLSAVFIAFASACGAGDYSIDPCNPDPNDPYHGMTLANCKTECAPGYGGYCFASNTLAANQNSDAWTCLKRTKDSDTFESLTPNANKQYRSCITVIPVK